MRDAVKYPIYAAILMAIAALGYVGMSVLYGALRGPSTSTGPTKVVEGPSPAKVALPPFCMGDAELNDFLKYAAYGPISYGSQKCGERFPDLKAEADADVDALLKKHGAFLTAVEGGSLPAYTRSFGPDGAKRRDASLDTDHKATFQRILAYSRDECTSHLAAIEGFGHMSQVEFDNALATIAKQSWETQRSSVPVCG